MTVKRLAAVEGAGPGAGRRAREGSTPALSNLALCGLAPAAAAAPPATECGRR